MRDWTGIDTSSLPPPTSPEFMPRTRRMLGDIDYFLRDLSRGIGRIQNGETPDGSGNPIGGGGTLTDYWFKPGISDPFTAFMSTGASAGGTISSTAHDTKGKILLGSSTAYDEGNIRLGIGTTSPSAMVHISAAAATIFSRPIATAGSVNNWHGQDSGTTNLQNYVNELTLDESTYVQEIPGSPGTVLTWTMWAANNIPFTGSPTISLTFRARRSAVGAGTEQLHFDLYRSATLVTAQNSGVMSTSFSDFTYALSAGEVTSLFNAGADGCTIDMYVVGIGATGYDVAQVTMTITTGTAQTIAKWEANSVETGRITTDGYLQSRRLNLTGTTSGTVTFAGGTTPATHSYTVPTAQGAALSLLQNDGAGQLSWATGSSIVDVARTWTTLQTFKDTTFKLVDDGDATKTAVFSLGGASANADLTLAWSGTADRTVTLPNATGTIPTNENANTITGAWFFDTVSTPNDLIFNIATTSGGGPVGAGNIFYKDAVSGFTSEMGITAAGLTADRTMNIPDATGDIVLTQGTQTITSKIFGTANNFLRASTSSAGVAFADNASTGKQLRMVMSGLTASTNNTFTLTGTVVHDWKFPDYSGSVVTVGNTASAASVLGIQDLTAQTGNITAKTMLTSDADSSGMFRLSFYLKTTTAGSAGSTVKVTVAFSDGAAQTADVLLTNLIATPAAPAVGHDLTINNNASYGEITVFSAASNAITFTTTGTYNTNPAYTLRARIEHIV